MKRMENQIHSAFEEIKAEQKLKTNTKYFLCELYSHKKTLKHNPRKKLVLAPLVAMLAVILTVGIFTTSVPVSAVSFDVENTSVELELNSLNKVVRVRCFGEADSFTELELKNLDCERAVALIIEKAKKENADIASAVLTVNCKNDKKAEKLSDKICINGARDISVSCHSTHSKLYEEAYSYGISTGKYQAYLTLKEYIPDLSIEEIRVLTMRELKEKINSYTHASSSEITSHPHNSEHYNGQSAGNGNRHEKNK